MDIDPVYTNTSRRNIRNKPLQVLLCVTTVTKGTEKHKKILFNNETTHTFNRVTSLDKRSDLAS